MLLGFAKKSEAAIANDVQHVCCKEYLQVADFAASCARKVCIELPVKRNAFSLELCLIGTSHALLL